MNIRCRDTLTADERYRLQTRLSGGKGAVRRITRAQILRAADAQSPDDLIARTVGVGTSTVYTTKPRFVEDGLAPALSELPRPGAPRKLGPREEALLIAVACSQPRRGGPDGRWICWPARWCA